MSRSAEGWCGDVFDVSGELRARHGCEHGCPGCRGVELELRGESLVDRFGALVASAAGLRMAAAHANHGIAFPRLAVDPLEQWLIEEALMVRFQAIRDEAHRVEEAKREMEDARAAARDALKGTGG